MSYIIVSARYASADNVSVVMTTSDFGAVLVSQEDRPKLWEKLQAWVAGGNQIGAYQAPVLDARIAADAADEATCKADPNVITFLNMSPVEVDAWIDTNVGGAATLVALRTSTVTALKVLAKLAQQGARGRRLRNGN